MSRSHDHWCHNCKIHFSPFECLDGCPVCGDEGTYDLNHEYGEGEYDALQAPLEARQSLTRLAGRLRNLCKQLRLRNNV